MPCSDHMMRRLCHIPSPLTLVHTQHCHPAPLSQLQSIKYHLFAQRRREQRLQQRGAGNAGGAAADSSQAAAPSAADAPPPAAAASAAATAAAAAAPAQRQPTSSGGFAAHPMDCGQGQQQRQRYCFFAHPEHVPWIPFTVPSADEALAVLRKNTQHCRQVMTRCLLGTRRARLAPPPPANLVCWCG